MRILAHMHTMNDAAVIEQLLDGLRRQTHQLDAMLIVDNASTDNTLDRTLPENATIIRNSENRGTSGPVRTAFAYALEHNFDWVWIFDADSVPEPDALEKLLAFFERLSPEKQSQVCFLAGRALATTGKIKQLPILLEGTRGMTMVPLESSSECAECDCVIWSGSLFRAAAIAQIGLPSDDYLLDVAELEYGYRARQLGLTSYVVYDSVIYHDVGRISGAAARRGIKLGRFNLELYEISPIRCYYSVRNSIYFFLYQYKPVRMSVALRAIVRAAGFTVGFFIRPISHRRQLAASVRGMWDGLTAHMERRY